MDKILNKQASKVLSGKSKKPPTPTKKEMRQAEIIETILEFHDDGGWDDMTKIRAIDHEAPELKLLEKTKAMKEYAKKNYTYDKGEMKNIKSLILKQAKDYAQNKKNTKIYKKYSDYMDYRESIENPSLHALKKSIRSRKMSG